MHVHSEGQLRDTPKRMQAQMRMDFQPEKFMPLHRTVPSRTSIL